jgi:hypothetical protein
LKKRCEKKFRDRLNRRPNFLLGPSGLGRALLVCLTITEAGELGNFGVTGRPIAH